MEPSLEGAPEEKKTEPLFEIKKWNAVALWTFNVHQDTCVICRTPLQELCIDCASAQTAQDSCVIAWGKCHHAFHYHCISRWLKSRDTCPMDNQHWEYERIGEKPMT